LKNPKSEYRNPKQIRIQKVKSIKLKKLTAEVAEHAENQKKE